MPSPALARSASKLSAAAPRELSSLSAIPAALDILRQNLSSLKIGPQATVLRGSALRYLKDSQADIIFIDPPYHQTADYEATLLLASSRCRLAIAQHDAKFQLENQYNDLHRTRALRQGSNVLSFFETVEG